MASRFLIVPFAVGVLGRGHYGNWVIVGQIFAYTRILEMGLRSALARQVALGRENGQPARLDRYMNTANAYYCAVGLLVAVATVAISAFYPDWFHLEPSYHTSARVMVLCVGFALALTIPQYAYGAVLGGLQRYDVISATQIGGEVLRLVLIFALLEHWSFGGGLVLLAVAAGGSTLLAATARTIVSVRMHRWVKFEPWRPDRRLFWDMATFGINSVVYMMSVTVVAQFALIMIGAKLSAVQVTDFRLAMELITAVHVLVVACTVVIRPAASRYDGQGNKKMLGHLLVRSTRYIAVVTLMGLLALVVFPEAFLRLWQGENYSGPEGAAAIARIARTCRVLSVGFGLFWLLLPAYSVLNGMGRHRFPAGVACAAALVSTGLVLVLVSWEEASIELVAWGVMLPMIPMCGIVMVWYACREVGESVVGFLWRGVVPAVICCVPPFVLAWLLDRFYPASSWWMLIGEAGCAVAVLAPLGWFVGFSEDDKAAVMASLAARLRRLRGR